MLFCTLQILYMLEEWKQNNQEDATPRRLQMLLEPKFKGILDGWGIFEG